MNLRPYLRYSLYQFNKQHIPEPTHSLDILLQHCHLGTLSNLLRHNHRISFTQWRTLHRLISRRLRHEPLQYLLGQWEFHYNLFTIRRPVLIPRQETEYSIDLIYQRLQSIAKQKAQNTIRFLEVGVGSGCIAISLIAKSIKQGDLIVHGTGLDIKSTCISLATLNRDNILGSHANRLDLIRQSIEQYQLQQGEQPYDILISNPPYIKSHQICCLQKQVRLYEDRSALDGGYDGLDVARTILRRAPQLVRPGGQVFLELGHDNASELAQQRHVEQGQVDTIKQGQSQVEQSQSQSQVDAIEQSQSQVDAIEQGHMLGEQYLEQSQVLCDQYGCGRFVVMSIKGE